MKTSHGTPLVTLGQLATLTSRFAVALPKALLHLAEHGIDIGPVLRHTKQGDRLSLAIAAGIRMLYDGHADAVPLGVSLCDAREIMGEGNFLGPEAIENTFGFRPGEENIPPIPFTRQEFEAAARRGEMLVLNWDETKEGKPLTIERMVRLAIANLPGKSNVIETNPDGTPKRLLLYSGQFEQDGSIKTGAWFKNDQKMLAATPKRGWQLVSPDIIPDSTSENALDQTQLLLDRMKADFRSGTFPAGSEEQKAEEEWSRERPNIQKLIDDGQWQDASHELSKLIISDLVREPIGNTILRYLVAYRNGRQLFTDGKYSWSNTLDSGGGLARFGLAGATGADVNGSKPGSASGSLGVVSSRRKL